MHADPSLIISKLETQLSLPPGFFRSLVEEPDWSFVIKSHAFLEAVLARSLAEALSNEALRPVFANLDTSDPKRGKLAFMKALDIVTHEDRRFLSRLSEVRNLLVHDVAFTKVDLANHFASLEPATRNAFMEAFAYAIPKEGIELGGRHLDPSAVFDLSPKLAIWTGLYLFTSRAYALAQAMQLGDILAVIEFYETGLKPRAA